MADGDRLTLVRYIQRLAGPRAVAPTADGQLLERYTQHKDDQAFAALVQRHGPMVLGVCRRLLPQASDADDAFQATFLVLARKARSIRRHASVASWLFGVARRVAWRLRGDIRRRQTHESQVSYPPPGDQTGAVDADVAGLELRGLVVEEVGRLPDKFRLPLILCYWEGKTHEQIAADLGVPCGSMAKRLDQARALLRQRLTRRGVTLSAGPLATALAEETATAAVPVGLASRTIQAALLYAVGHAATAGSLTGNSWVLAEEVLRAMFLRKLKTLTIVLCISAFVAAAGFVANHVVSAKPAGVPAPGLRQAAAAQPPVVQPAAAKSHRVLILDTIENHPAAADQELRVLDIEAGKTVARAVVGYNSDFAVSPKGDVVAAIYSIQVHGVGRPGSHLDFYRAGDLHLNERGLLPPGVPRLGHQMGASHDSRLSPDGRELLVEGPDPAFSGNVDLAQTVLNVVKREVDSDGFFKHSRQTVRVPHSYGVELLRVADWPRVQLWNSYLGLLEVADLDRGRIVSRLLLTDGLPANISRNPAELEKADARQMMRLRHRGHVIAGERYAYYLPTPRWDSREPPGLSKKIDLTANPPRVVLRGKERQPALRTAAVSEPVGALFVLKDERSRDGRELPSRRVKVISTKDLTLQREFDLPVKEAAPLATSQDGKYLYALDRDQAKLAVIDTATGRPVKVLSHVGKYPYLLIPMPEPR
jgi:RNA polymerase sigma factor (sigma-70 family)